MMNKMKIMCDFSFDQPTALGVSFSKDAIEKAIQNSADVPILLYEGGNNTPCVVGHGKFAKVLKVDEHNQIISAQLDAILYSFDDLADAFWNALRRYVKRPNKKDLKKMYDMWLWACHDSHAQSTNFTRAWQWCKIDIWKEKARTDIPEE